MSLECVEKSNMQDPQPLLFRVLEKRREMGGRAGEMFFEMLSPLPLKFYMLAFVEISSTVPCPYL